MPRCFACADDGTLNNGKKSTLIRLEDGDPRIAQLQRQMGHGVGSNPYHAHEHTPVSYTHLTLPTKRIV